MSKSSTTIKAIATPNRVTAHPGEVLSEELLSHSSQLDQLDMVAPWSRL
jgi:hypothetical protein